MTATNKTVIKLLKQSDNLWTAPDTKYLSNIEVTKGAYGYHIFLNNGDDFSEVGRGRTQKDVIAWIKEYDNLHEEKLESQILEEIAREKAYEERIKQINTAHEAYCKSPLSIKSKVGDRLTAKFAARNKNNSIGEYAAECALSEKDQENQYWDRNKWVTPNNWSICVIEICSVITLTNEQYDELADNLMCNETCAKYGITPDMGGNSSSYIVDEVKYPNCSFFMRASEEERIAWRKESWIIVGAITAPNRRTFYVDTQGYGYARYVGLVA